VKVLLEAGADVRLQTEHEGVVLMHAAQKNQLEVTKLLLETSDAKEVRKRSFGAIYTLKNDHFTKTGSGQT
jgi:ankyrin repeat protein